MEVKWLKKLSSQKVVVLFSGWAFSEKVFDHLLGDGALDNGFDVLLINDYRDLSVTLPDLSEYQESYLVAWSFGVASAAHWLSENSGVEFTKMIAVNGSLKPIDRRFGIADAVMQKTIDTLSDDSLSVFMSRCLPEGVSLEGLNTGAAISDLKDELEAVKERGECVQGDWHKVIASQQDKIFTARNVLRFWESYNAESETKVEIQVIDAPHMPFTVWESWRELLS